MFPRITIFRTIVESRRNALRKARVKTTCSAAVLATTVTRTSAGYQLFRWPAHPVCPLNNRCPASFTCHCTLLYLCWSYWLLVWQEPISIDRRRVHSLIHYPKVKNLQLLHQALLLFTSINFILQMVKLIFSLSTCVVLI